MKFFTAFAVLAAAAVSVGAANVETNAARMARGLPPLPPAKRASNVLRAPRHEPSSTPECKPLLQSCDVNSECCADVCLLGLCL